MCSINECVLSVLGGRPTLHGEPPGTCGKNQAQVDPTGGRSAILGLARLIGPTSRFSSKRASLTRRILARTGPHRRGLMLFLGGGPPFCWT